MSTRHPAATSGAAALTPPGPEPTTMTSVMTGVGGRSAAGGSRRVLGTPRRSRRWRSEETTSGSIRRGGGLEDRGHEQDPAAQRPAWREQGGGGVERPDAPGMSAHELEQRRVPRLVGLAPDDLGGGTVALDQVGRCGTPDQVTCEDLRLDLEGGRIKARGHGGTNLPHAEAAQPQPEEVAVLVERLVDEVELGLAPVLALHRHLHDPPPGALREEAHLDNVRRALIDVRGEAPRGLDAVALGGDRVVVVGHAEQEPCNAQERVRGEPADPRALLLAELLRPHDDLVCLEQLERPGQEGQVDREIHVDREQEGIARPPHELAEREADAAGGYVEEGHVRKAQDQVNT